jgi:hypothetical protein
LAEKRASREEVGRGEEVKGQGVAVISGQQKNREK